MFRVVSATIVSERKKWKLWHMKVTSKSMEWQQKLSRQAFVQNNPSMDIKTLDAIKAGRVLIGMTQDQVKASWGVPSDVNRTTSTYGVKEQWIYNIGNVDRNYLYFDDGILTTIQN